jgi:hypothetical protein
MSEIFVYEFILVTGGSRSLGVLKGLQDSQNSRLLDSSIFLSSGPGILRFLRIILYPKDPRGLNEKQKIQNQRNLARLNS